MRASRAEVIESLSEAESLVAEWDRLAEELGRPYGLSAWLLAWQRHVAPSDSDLRVIAVHGDDRLQGLFPLSSHPGPGGQTSFRFLGSDTSMPVGPLLEDAVAPEVTSVAVDALRAKGISVLSLRGFEVPSPWRDALVDGIREGGSVYVEDEMPAPFVRPDGRTYEEWLQSRSSNFRQQVRRARRKAEEKGAVFRRVTDPSEATDAIEIFERLHLDRWRERGGSLALRPGVREMLLEVAQTEVAAGRLRIFTIEVDGKPVSVQLFLVAGGRSSYWLGAFDPTTEIKQAGLQGVLAGIEDACEHGLFEVDLGPGDDRYKQSLTDDAVTLKWETVLAGGPGYLARRVRFLPYRSRRAAARRLPEGLRVGLRKALRRS